MNSVGRLGQTLGREDALLFSLFLIRLMYYLSCSPLKIWGCNLLVNTSQLRHIAHQKSCTFVLLSQREVKNGVPFYPFPKQVGQVTRQVGRKWTCRDRSGACLESIANMTMEEEYHSIADLIC